MAQKNEVDHNWFGDLLAKFIPTDLDIEGKTPEEMVKSASWKAFAISTAAAIHQVLLATQQFCRKLWR